MNLKQITAASLLAGRIGPSGIQRYLEAQSPKPSRALEFVSSNNIKVTALQIALEEGMSFRDYLGSLCEMLDTAVAEGSQLVCFPEYIGLFPLLTSKTFYEMAYRFSDDLLNQRQREIAQASAFFEHHLAGPLLESYYNLFSLLASQYRIYIQAGSTVVKGREGLFNRAYLFGPDGKPVMEQNKLHLSQMERLAGLKPGSSLEVADTQLGKVAILLGKDQRVFEGARQAYSQGVRILLCPAGFSVEEGEACFQSGAFMRCQEQPLYAVCSWFAGDFMDLPFRGRAGIFAPFSVSKLGNGMVAQSGTLDGDACLTARIDLDRLGRDIDLYTSDRNAAIQEQLWQEYQKPRISQPTGLEGQPPPRQESEEDGE